MRAKALVAQLWVFVAAVAVAAALLANPVSAANPGHGAASIGPGTFEAGNYTFPQNLVINGKVGIGKTPAQSLDVVGIVNITQALYVNNSLVCTSTNGQCAGIGGMINGQGTTGYLPIWQNGTYLNNSPISFDSNTQMLTYWYDLGGGTFAPAMKMDLNNQFVSIGITDPTVAPEAPLAVSALASNSGVIKVHSQDNVAGDNWWIGFSDNGLLNTSDWYDLARVGATLSPAGSGRLFFTTGTANNQIQRMTIDENGVVNMTNGPAYVNGSQVCTAANGQCSGSGGSVSGGSAGYIAQWKNSTALNNSAIFQNGTNIGIGTTTPAQKLDINGSINVAQTAYAYNVTLTGNSIQDSGNTQRIKFESGNIIFIIG